MSYAHSVTLPLLWGDMDALGHVNNARYFRWLETARIALLGRIGHTPVTGATRVGPILATITCDFLAPVVFPGDVTIGASVTRVGTTSLTMTYGIWLTSQPERLSARGSSVVVFVEYATGAKVPIAQEMRDRIAAL